jgi:hypothetical protein
MTETYSENEAHHQHIFFTEKNINQLFMRVFKQITPEKRKPDAKPSPIILNLKTLAWDKEFKGNK